MDLELVSTPWPDPLPVPFALLLRKRGPQGAEAAESGGALPLAGLLAGFMEFQCTFYGDPAKESA